MSSFFFTASQYVAYWFRAVGPHSLHSPFLFDLFNKAIKPSRRKLQSVELIRTHLESNDQQIDVVDFKTGRVKRSTVGHVASTSLSTAKFSNFLRLLCNYLQIETALETGTSLGINALYLSKSESLKKVVTIEGSDIIARLAKEIVAAESKIHIVTGNIHQCLKQELVRHQPELVFIDADHRGEVVQNALESIVELCPRVKCVVIHDIYWSEDMKSGWTSIVKEEKYPLTIDIFQAGLIFPHHPIVKQHFTLRF